MPKLTCVAIDDEVIAIEVVKKFAAKVPFIDVIGYFTNPMDALGFMHENTIDILFVDIKMPDISGLDFVKSLPYSPLVIFTTAYSEHAVQSFELEAIDYLLKPFSFSRFLKACNKAKELHSLKHLAEKTDYVFVKSGYDKIKIVLDDILYVESQGNYMVFYTSDARTASRMTMKEIETLLPDNMFIRIHRSFVVCKSHIRKVGTKDIWVKDKVLPIGKEYEANLKTL